MSTYEPIGEQRSSVKITMNAKGEAQVEVKSYVGTDDAALDTAREQAVRIYTETARSVRVTAGASS